MIVSLRRYFSGVVIGGCCCQLSMTVWVIFLVRCCSNDTGAVLSMTVSCIYPMACVASSASHM